MYEGGSGQYIHFSFFFLFTQFLYRNRPVSITFLFHSSSEFVDSLRYRRGSIWHEQVTVCWFPLAAYMQSKIDAAIVFRLDKKVQVLLPSFCSGMQNIWYLLLLNHILMSFIRWSEGFHSAPVRIWSLVRVSVS